MLGGLFLCLGGGAFALPPPPPLPIAVQRFIMFGTADGVVAVTSVLASDCRLDAVVELRCTRRQGLLHQAPKSMLAHVPVR